MTVRLRESIKHQKLPINPRKNLEARASILPTMQRGLPERGRE